MSGPLHGIKIIELAGIGPTPFGCMLLADMGADVVCVDRVAKGDEPFSLHGRQTLRRNRRSICIDLSDPRGTTVIRQMLATVDVFVEGFRPGVVERLGLGPDDLTRENPRLVYARMTGWGQQGPRALTPGHDINYIAVAGALEALGREGGAPVPPLNLVGDNGGGGFLLAFGVLCALMERTTSGQGQVIDVAMIDGSALLTTNFHGMLASGTWDEQRGSNQCPAAPFYDVYETADGKYVAVGAQERKFYGSLMSALDFDVETLPEQSDHTTWAHLKGQVADRIKKRTRDEWDALFREGDACVSPVLSFREAPSDPQNMARQTFVSCDGVMQPAPAPRFDRTPASAPSPPPEPGLDTDEVLASLGYTVEEARALKSTGIVA